MTVLLLILITALCLFAEYEYYKSTGTENIYYSQRYNVKSAFEGEQVELVEQIHNQGFMPQPALGATYTLPKGAITSGGTQKHTSFFFMWGLSKIERHNIIKCGGRCFHLGSVILLESEDFFGLSSQSGSSYNSTSLFVYPRPMPWRDMPFEARRFGEAVDSRRFIFPDPVLVSGIRAYTSTDSYRDIHWNASAHTGTLQSKIRSYQTDPHIWIVLNTELDNDAQDARVEQGIRMAAGLMEWVIERGYEAGFICNAYIQGYSKKRTVEFSFSEMDRNGEQFLRFLSMLRTGGQCPLSDTLKQLVDYDTCDADIAVLSDELGWDDSCDLYKSTLEQNGCTVNRIPLEARK